MKGRFITFEGIEGCGKTTQIQLLRDHLATRGERVEITREPGGVAIAESIRKLLLDAQNAEMTPTTELLLYEAARAQHVAQRIRPLLDAGIAVLCDRFYDSTTAYQGAGRGFPLEELERLHRLATNGLSPDLTILIDLPVEEGLARAKRSRKHDRIESESAAFHEKVRAGFLELADREPDRIKVVDGRPPVKIVAAKIAGIVSESTYV